MKFAVAFLILAIGGCFVSALFNPAPTNNGLKACKRKMSKEDGDTIATLVVFLLYKTEQSKVAKTQGQCDKKCLIRTANFALRLVTGFKGCSMDSVIDTVISCIDSDPVTKSAIKQVLNDEHGNTDLPLNVDVNIIVKAVFCAANKIVSEDGHDFSKSLKGSILTLNGFLGPLLGNILRLIEGLLPTSLGLVFNALNNVITSIAGGALGV